MIRLSRVFFGNYAPNYAKLTQMKYALIRRNKSIISVTSADHGLGEIKGSTKKLGNNYSPVPVCVFKRSNRQLIWETKSKPDGTYAFRNIAKGLECFVVAFDPAGQYNAVIQDKVVAK